MRDEKHREAVMMNIGPFLLEPALVFMAIIKWVDSQTQVQSRSQSRY